MKKRFRVEFEVFVECVHEDDEACREEGCSRDFASMTPAFMRGEINTMIVRNRMVASSATVTELPASEGE